MRNLSNTTGGIAIGHTIDAGSHALTLQTTAAITKTGGGLLKAGSLSLQAIKGIGTAGTPLAIRAGNLGATTSTGGVFLASTSDLTTIGAGTLKTLRSTISGDVVLESTGAVLIPGGTQVATNVGNIRLVGISSPALGGGIVIDGGTIDGHGGNVSLTGTGVTNDADGIGLGGGGTVQTSGAGAVSLLGTGFQAVSILDSGTRVSTVDGPLSITGNSLSSPNAQSVGVFLFGGPIVQATGAGGITLTGTGSPNGAFSPGVFVVGSTVSVDRGPLTINGTGRGGGTNRGVDVDSSTIRSTGSGNIRIQGTAPEGTTAIAFNGNFSGNPGTIAAGTGDVTLIGDAIALGATGSVSGARGFSFMPLTRSRPIQIGGADAAGRLVVTDADLAALAPGFRTLVIGDPASTGSITTGAALPTFTSDVLIGSPGFGSAGITINHSINVGTHSLSLITSGPLAIDSGAALTAAGKTVSLQGSTITVGFARLDAVPGGQIVFNGDTTLGPKTFLALALTPAQVNGPPLIVVNGTLNLGGAFLAFSGPGGIPAGSRFTAISNDGADAIVGGFAQGGQDVVAGDLYLITTNVGDGNDVVLVRPTPVPPIRRIAVQLVTKVIKKGRKKTKTLFLDALFMDDNQLKTEIKSPFQAPKFKNITFTTADKNGDGVIDTVLLSAKQGKKTKTVTLPI